MNRDIDAGLDGELVAEKASEPVTEKVGEGFRSDPSEVSGSAGWSHASAILNIGEEDTDMLALLFKQSRPASREQNIIVSSVREPENTYR